MESKRLAHPYFNLPIIGTNNTPIWLYIVKYFDFPHRWKNLGLLNDRLSITWQKRYKLKVND